MTNRGLDLGLEGRVALVTGAAGGMGAKVGKLLSEAGARVFGVDRNSEALEQAAAQWVGAHNGHAALDLGQVADCHTAVERALALTGRLDILIAVHGVLVRREIETMDENEYDGLMAINARSHFFLAKAALPAMRQERFGRIVLFTSPSGFMGSPTNASAYAMSKVASLGLARSIARRYGPENITCNLVSPGSIDTPMMRTGLTEADVAAMRNAIPMRRLGDPQEVALGAIYLVSRWGSYVNGHVLVVDGGATMHA